MPCGEREYDRSSRAGTRHAQQQGQVMNAARAAASSTLYWQCVGLCRQARTLGLKVIERHRLNQFIALHRAGGRVTNPVRHAAMQVVAVCQAKHRRMVGAGQGAAWPARRGCKPGQHPAAAHVAREPCAGGAGDRPRPG